MEARKNDVVNGKIVDMNDDGQGVLKTKDNLVIFVPNTITGEIISAQIINTKSKFAIGKLKEVQLQSADRVTPPCAYYAKCGGCDLMHCSKNFQLNFKTNKVKSAFLKIAGVDTSVQHCISLNEFRYRNKIALPISSSGEIGLYRKNSHSVLEISDCIITENWNKDLICCIKDYINSTKISCYNEESKTGLLKHVVARKIDDALLVTLVINGDEIPNVSFLIDLLKNQIF